MVEDKHTQGPWKVCTANEGKCKCGQVWSIPADCPVATVVIGEWGDEYPAIRVEKPGSIGAVAEPYMEKINYGSIDVDECHANARLIASAPIQQATIERLREALEFYADLESYEETVTESLPVNDIPIGRVEIDGPDVLDDGGSRARAALAESELD